MVLPGTELHGTPLSYVLCPGPIAHAYKSILNFKFPKAPPTELRMRSGAAMWKARLNQVILVSRTAFKWGWIPFLIYLGERGSEAGLALRELHVTGAVILRRY